MNPLPATLATMLVVLSSTTGCASLASPGVDRLVNVVVISEVPRAMNLTVLLDGVEVLTTDMPPEASLGHPIAGREIHLAQRKVRVEVIERDLGEKAERRLTLARENTVMVKLTPGGIVIEHADRRLGFA